MFEVTPSFSSDQNGIKLEIDKKLNFMNTWKLNDTLLKNK